MEDPPAAGQLRNGYGKCKDMWGNTSLLGITLLGAAAWICGSKSTMKDEKKSTAFPQKEPNTLHRTSEPGLTAEDGF